MTEDQYPHTAEYCLARAVRCEELAAKTTFEANKAIFLDMAKRWRSLAEESKQPLVGRAIGSPSRIVGKSRQ
jgi:hypothetical protein